MMHFIKYGTLKQKVIANKWILKNSTTYLTISITRESNFHVENQITGREDRLEIVTDNTEKI